MRKTRIDKKEKMCGIYMITCLKNNKSYIGQSKNIRIRFSQHKSGLNKNKHGNEYLQIDWNYYGEENFDFDIIEFCEIENLIKRENYYIDYYNTLDKNYGYNCYKDYDENKNRDISDEVRQKMRDAQKSIPIIQLDLKGKFIKEWSGAREASKALNIEQSCIWNCLYGKRRTYRGYIWILKCQFDLGWFDLNNYVNQGSQPRKIVQIDNIGNIIKKFESISDAAKFFNLDTSTVAKVCKGRYKTTKGYIFMYADEYNKKLAKYKVEKSKTQKCLEIF